MLLKSVFWQLFQKLNILDSYTFQSELLNHESQHDHREDDKDVSSEIKVWQELKWSNIFFITVFHFLAVHSIFTFAWKVSPMFIVWAFLIGTLGGLGVTGGAHRLWAHKSYKAKLPFQIFILFCYTLAGQNNLHAWVRDHRVHHKFSDTDADPHNASRGFFFSHVGWLMVKKHPLVIKKGRTVDMSDIESDPLLQIHRRYFIPLKILIAFVFPSIVPPLIWGEPWYYSIFGMCCVRYIISLNITWSVNSAAHIWGNKPYEAKIRPSENKAVSFLSLGEGWHNYHHVFPWDYKAAELGPMSSSLTTSLIDFGFKLGLVYDRKEPSRELIEKVAKNHGDGTWKEHTEYSEETEDSK